MPRQQWRLAARLTVDRHLGGKARLVSRHVGIPDSLFSCHCLVYAVNAR